MTEKTKSLYPQAKPFTTEEVAAFLQRPLIAKLSSHNADGTIHSVPLWFTYQDGDILFGTQEVTNKIANIKRDPRVTVLIDTVEPALQAVLIYATAVLDYENVIAKRTAIFANYMPADQAAGFSENLASSWQPVIIRVQPERIVTFDYTKGLGL